jgi:excisionase family DNA binding protein
MKQAHNTKPKALQKAASGGRQSPVNEHHQKGTSRSGGSASATESINRPQAKGNRAPASAVVASSASSPSVTVGEERLLTTGEVAGRLQFSVRKVREYVRTGKLPAVRLNRRDMRFHWPTVVTRLVKK